MLGWSLLTVFILIITGCAFQMDFFLKNAFGLYFFLLLFFAISMIAMTALISTLVKKSSSAVTISFVVLMIGYAIEKASGSLYTSTASDTTRTIVALFSPSMFQLGVSILGQATDKVNSPGLSWSVVNDEDAIKATLSIADMYGYLVLDTLIYFLLALYLDNVIPSKSISISNVIKMHTDTENHFCISYRDPIGQENKLLFLDLILPIPPPVKMKVQWTMV